MVVACDMPLVEPTIFGKLIDVAKGQPALDAVIPRVAGQAQPFHGLWHVRALPLLEEKWRLANWACKRHWLRSRYHGWTSMRWGSSQIRKRFTTSIHRKSGKNCLGFCKNKTGR